MKAILPVILCCFLTLNSVIASPAHASDKFSTSVLATYTVDNNGMTEVDLRATLKNKTAQFYAREYKLALSTDDIQNIRARDNSGNILREYQQQNEQTLIFLIFNEPIVGIDKEQTFRISYQSNSLANKNGNIWKVKIPALPESETIDNYTAILDAPTDFPQPARFKPEPSQSKKNTYIWEGTKLKKNGAIAYFGSQQNYNARLKYKLVNEKNEKAKMSIALPPDTAYQKVYLLQIEPQPQNILPDSDGNWLAYYPLEAKEAINVYAELAVQTFINPRKEFPNLYTENLLSEEPFWEVNNQKIRQISAGLKDVEAIFDYTAENLSYNYKKIAEDKGRLGAVDALNNLDYAVCTEFTDLFITLARAAGIPAREINGYAYTQDTSLQPLSLVADLLHSWPEYYDVKRTIWVPVDPTWQNTTGGVDYFNLLDFDHITFVIHGSSSTSPRPVGANAKDFIDVQFAAKAPKRVNKGLRLELDFPEKVLADANVHGLLTITNLNNYAQYNVAPIISSDPLPITQINPIPILPPNAKYKQTLEIPAAHTRHKVSNTIAANYNGTSTETTVIVLPANTRLIGFVLAGIISIVLLATAIIISKKIL